MIKTKLNNKLDGGLGFNYVAKVNASTQFEQLKKTFSKNLINEQLIYRTFI